MRVGRGERRLAFVSLALVLLLAEAALRLSGDRPGLLATAPAEYVPLKTVDHLEVDPAFYTDGTGTFRARLGRVAWDPLVVINDDGFRSRPFEPAPPGVRSVFFIGDSFTWGGSAKPLTEAFPDLVARAGWHVWNGGIPGADPDQYALVARRFVARLHPDVVVVTFFMGNDVMWQRRALRPWQNRYHPTNAGWLNPFLDGDYVGDAQQTYDYYRRRYLVPDGLRHWVFGTSALGSRAYRLLRPRLDPQVEERQRLVRERWTGRTVSHEYLQEVRAVCAAEGVRFLLLVAPEVDRIDEDIAAAWPKLFADLPWTRPPGLLRADYNPMPDGHFNNAGHRKMADYVLTLLGSGR